MPNPPRLDLVYKAVRSGVLGRGHIEMHPTAAERVRDDPEMQRFTPRAIMDLLRDFVTSRGGRIDVRQQGFEQWLNADPDNPYWYRAVIDVPEFPRGLFVEIIITDNDEQEPWVQIVSAHPQSA